ncbi:MAG: thioredoxin-disulfide reductase [bacterium]
MDTVENVIIIGSGPAGYTAALYTSRALLQPLLFAGNEPGGQLTLTTEIENFPGFPEGIQGPDLMEAMKKQVERFGTRIVQAMVTSVDLSKQPYKVIAGGKEYFTKTLVIASGASANWLNLPSEQEYRGRGVSSCATCDAFFFRGKKLFVVGGGNSALQEALFLTNFASHITIVHRRDAFRGEKTLQEKIFSHEKISVIWNSEVQEVFGDGKKVTGIRILHKDLEISKEYETDGLFVFIGHTPNTGLFKDVLPVDSVGYIQATDEVKTPLAGVFVAGDVADNRYRQAITAAGMGCKAALEVEHFLQK